MYMPANRIVKELVIREIEKYKQRLTDIEISISKAEVALADLLDKRAKFLNMISNLEKILTMDEKKNE